MNYIYVLLLSLAGLFALQDQPTKDTQRPLIATAYGIDTGPQPIPDPAVSLVTYAADGTIISSINTTLSAITLAMLDGVSNVINVTTPDVNICSATTGINIGGATLELPQSATAYSVIAYAIGGRATQFVIS